MASVGVVAQPGFTRRQWTGVAVSTAGVAVAAFAAVLGCLKAVAGVHGEWEVLLPILPAAVLLLVGNWLLSPHGGAR